MGNAVLEGDRSADIHLFCFQAAKRSDMYSVEMQGQEWYFQSAKRSDKSCTILQKGRFALAQEERPHGAKCLNMGSAVQQ